MQALVGVIDPELGRSVVELDMVRDVEIDGGRVDVTIALTFPGCPLRASFEEQVQSALAHEPGPVGDEGNRQHHHGRGGELACRRHERRQAFEAAPVDA